MASHSQKIPATTRMKLLLIITAAAITVTGILFRQDVFRIIPLYVSLFIGLMQSQANRYANLIGAGNAIMYGFVNLHFKMYASAASAMLVSSPFQLATFFRWNKHKYKNSTEFRSLTGKQRILTAFGYILVCIIVYILLSTVDSGYRTLDTLSSLLGLLISTLTLLSYVEYTWLQLPSAVLGIAKNIAVALDHPEQITYVIYSVYTLICMIIQYITVQRLSDEQRTESTQ